MKDAGRKDVGMGSGGEGGEPCCVSFPSNSPLNGWSGLCSGWHYQYWCWCKYTGTSIPPQTPPQCMVYCHHLGFLMVVSGASTPPNRKVWPPPMTRKYISLRILNHLPPPPNVTPAIYINTTISWQCLKEICWIVKGLFYVNNAIHQYLMSSVDNKLK